MCAPYHLATVFAHQCVVATDVGLALDTVKNQILNITSRRLHQFLRSWENSTTQPGNSAEQYLAEKIFGNEFVVGRAILVGTDCGVFAITFDNDAWRTVAMAC